MDVGGQHVDEPRRFHKQVAYSSFAPRAFICAVNDDSKGIQLPGASGTWVNNSAIAIDNDKYDIARDDVIDIRCTAAGTNGDAECLTVSLTLVYE